MTFDPPLRQLSLLPDSCFVTGAVDSFTFWVEVGSARSGFRSSNGAHDEMPSAVPATSVRCGLLVHC